jgi:hypothetical protein
MPNFKIFQDNPDQLKIKIHGSNNVAFNTDTSGNLAITTTGLAVTGNINVGTVTVTSTGLAVTGNINVGTVTVTSTGLAVTGNINVGTVTVTSTGLAVTGNINVGTVTVTTGSGSLAVCIGTGQSSVSIDNHGSTDVSETIANKTSTSYSGATSRTVLGYNAWTFALKNTSLATNAQALVQIQMSATAAAESDWVQEVSPVTINQNEVRFLTSSLLIKYARVYYAAVNASSAITLSIVYQAQG